MALSIRSKLLAAFGVIVALMLIVGLFAVSRLGSDDRQINRLATSVVPSTRTVGDINALLNKYRKDQLHYIVARPSDRPGAAGIDGDISGDLNTMGGLLASYQARHLVSDARDQMLLNGFRADFAQYVAITASFRSLADGGHVLQAGVVVGDGAGDNEYNKLKALISSWLDEKVAGANTAAADARASYGHGVALILLLLAAAVALALAVAVIFAQRVTRAVRAIGQAAKAISQGEIVARVPVSRRDELGELANDFDSMVEYLRGTVAVAETISSGDLDVDVQPQGDHDALGHALLSMTQSLTRVMAENEQLLRASRQEANSDALTGLPNRRALMRDLAAHAEPASAGEPLVLALFDLDGFKQYNDTFGHAAGDALLARLGDRLRSRLRDEATVYRIGGDEFCMLVAADIERGERLASSASGALSEAGEGFTIGCSYGVAEVLPATRSPEEALCLADQRMYERKAGRASASRQSTDVLLQALGERNPSLHEHISGVTELAVATAERMELAEHEISHIRIAAELHDIGKVAIPDSILSKPGPLDDDEWAFMRRHTLIGERIVLAAPSLAPAAGLVRSSHERHDGTGYPDGLHGDEIPQGASIVSVCDAFDAMISDRPYSESKSLDAAIAELRRCSGTQFHPDAVTALCETLLARRTDSPYDLTRAASAEIATSPLVA